MDKYKFSFEYVHKIGDIVYHRTNGDKGIVLDIIFHTHTNLVEYLVSFGRYNDDSVECVEQELSRDKVFI